jgi:hypothetical protein
VPISFYFAFFSIIYRFIKTKIHFNFFLFKSNFFTTSNYFFLPNFQICTHKFLQTSNIFLFKKKSHTIKKHMFLHPFLKKKKKKSCRLYFEKSLLLGAFWLRKSLFVFYNHPITLTCIKTLLQISFQIRIHMEDFNFKLSILCFQLCKHNSEWVRHHLLYWKRWE